MGCNLGSTYIVHARSSHSTEVETGRIKEALVWGCRELEMTFPKDNVLEQNLEEHMILIQAWPPDCL